MQLYYRKQFGYAIKLQVNDKERNKIVRYFVVSADSRINIRASNEREPKMSRQYSIEIEIEVLNGDEAYYPRFMTTVSYQPGARATYWEPAYGPEIEYVDSRVTFDSDMDLSDPQKVEKMVMDYIASDSGMDYLISKLED